MNKIAYKAVSHTKQFRDLLSNHAKTATVHIMSACRRHTNPRSVFCTPTLRSPSTWNPTGPDPGPESRPFEIGNPVHFDYARERARLWIFSNHREISWRDRGHIATREGRSSNSWNSRTLIRKTGLDRIAQGYVSGHRGPTRTLTNSVIWKQR